MIVSLTKLICSETNFLEKRELKKLKMINIKAEQKN